ncbi:MAG: hypothetical protein U5R48_19440 [Gammaproteobacteria bacterium]|nr:hypothetical protein [Gammaproteobacteria bacterium]
MIWRIRGLEWVSILGGAGAPGSRLAFPDQDAWLQRSLAARAGTALQIRMLGAISRARGSWRS